MINASMIPEFDIFQNRAMMEESKNDDDQTAEDDDVSDEKSAGKSENHGYSSDDDVLLDDENYETSMDTSFISVDETGILDARANHNNTVYSDYRLRSGRKRGYSEMMEE